MNSKKHSRAIAAICFGILLIFSLVVFPLILAATPSNSSIEAIEPNNNLNQTDSDYIPEFDTPDHDAQNNDELNNDTQNHLIQSSETIYNNAQNNNTKSSDSTPTTGEPPTPMPAIFFHNAITEEEAIRIAWEGFLFPEGETKNPDGTTHWHTTNLIEARYIECPISLSSSWFVLFSYRYGGILHENVPDGSTVEDILNRPVGNYLLDMANFSSKIDENGNTIVVWEYDSTHYEMVEINALTGEKIGNGMSLQIRTEDLLEILYWTNIKQGMDFWWTLTKSATGEIIRTPLYHHEGESSGG
ncbi:MAG: hypothetical protein LBC73_06755 [Oscillospiraceae bacterium]|jgi:hypothetical protein|nr:hypothetical protein [Oscillospiraceae bacterium]